MTTNNNNKIPINTLKRFEEYGDIINNTFTKEPKDVTQHILKIISHYPVKLYSIDKMSYILLVIIAPGFYGISWVCTIEDKRSQGYGSYLLDKIHNENKGIFITKVGKNTERAVGFYLRNGYRIIHSDNECTILVHINDKNVIDF